MFSVIILQFKDRSKILYQNFKLQHFTALSDTLHGKKNYIALFLNTIKDSHRDLHLEPLEEIENNLFFLILLNQKFKKKQNKSFHFMQQ